MTILPDCQMPDGADPCKGFMQLASELDHAHKQIAHWQRIAGQGITIERELRRESIRQQKEIERLREALIWCSGSGDFNEGGVARTGWLELCAPLISK